MFFKESPFSPFKKALNGAGVIPAIPPLNLQLSNSSSAQSGAIKNVIEGVNITKEAESNITPVIVVSATALLILVLMRFR